jgi:biopolymer transport protein ExbB/TolQ
MRTIVGSELAAGWSVTAAEPVEGGRLAWRVSLRHDNDRIALAVRERLTGARDPQIQLWPEDRPAQPAAWASSEPAAPPPAPISLPLPYETPGILVASEASQRKLAALLGVLTGIVLAAVLGFLTPNGSAIRQMFNFRTASAAVPTAILCLFFWGIVHGLDRRRRLGALDTLNAPDLLPAAVGALRAHGVKDLGQALDADIVQYSPLLRRIRVALEQWQLRPGLQNANLAIEQQIISDREATQRGYNILRIFVWATPVLGLIGTVVGISVAVGGFASFLSTDVDDISKIKEGLVGVTGGLSFAFLITLEGLLSSLILMLFTSSIQTREERLYAGVERGVAESFLPELQRVAPERETHDAGNWAEAMAAAARKVMEAVDAAATRLLAKWDEKHAGYVSDLKATNDVVQNSAKGLATAFTEAAAGQRAASEQALAAYAAEVTRASAAVSGLGQVTRQVLESQAALQTAMAQLRDSGLAHVLTDLDHSLKDLKPVLSNLSQPFVLQAIPVPGRAAGASGDD